MDSPAFLEVKSKDAEGIGHKFRLVSNPSSITRLMTDGLVDQTIQDLDLVQEIQLCASAMITDLQPQMYIHYDRLSLKETKSIQGYPYIRFGHPGSKLGLCDQQVSLLRGKAGEPLLEENTIIMEIKAPGEEPQWLKDILDKYGLVKQKFSKYSCAYHKSQGLDYAPTPIQERTGVAYV